MAWDRFTEQARKVIVAAQEEAERESMSEIQSWHLLLGLTREAETKAAEIMEKFGQKMQAKQIAKMMAEAKANQEGAIAAGRAKKKESGLGKSSNGIIVPGVENVMARLSRYCNPLPGDPIVGYITRGRGVSVHRLDCPNARHHMDEEGNRIVEVTWDAELIGSFTAEIQVISRDRNRLTSDILTAVADMKVPIHYIHSRPTQNGLAQTNMKVEIKNLDHLQYMIDKIGRIKDVQEVRRITPGKQKVPGGKNKAVRA